MLSLGDDNSGVYSIQHYMWATFGFLRGIATSTDIGSAFCTPLWAKLIMNMVDNFSSPLDEASRPVKNCDVTQQVFFIANFLPSYSTTGSLFEIFKIFSAYMDSRAT